MTHTFEVRRRVFPNGIIGYGVRTEAPMFLMTWCFRVGTTLIDTGFHHAETELTQAILADGPIENIVVTHHHEDHSGNAAHLQATTGAKMLSSQYAAPLLEKGFDIFPYQEISSGPMQTCVPDHVVEIPAYGETALEFAGEAFQLIHAPGHSFDMTILYWPKAKALFSADLFIAEKVKVHRRDVVWQPNMQALKNVIETYDIDHVMCAHFPTTGHGNQRLTNKYQNLVDFEKAVAEKHQAGLEPQVIADEILGPDPVQNHPVFCGDVSTVNMVLSALGQHEGRTDLAEIVGIDWVECRF